MSEERNNMGHSRRQGQKRTPKRRNDGVKDKTQLGVASTTGGSAWIESPMEGCQEGRQMLAMT